MFSPRWPSLPKDGLASEPRYMYAAMYHLPDCFGVYWPRPADLRCASAILWAYEDVLSDGSAPFSTVHMIECSSGHLICLICTLCDYSYHVQSVDEDVSCHQGV